MSGEFEDASRYDADLERGIRLSGYPKEHFANGRLDVLSRLWSPANAAPRILDFGCGLGETAALLAARYPAARVVGVDPSSSAIDEARRRYAGESTRFDTGETLEASAPFDLIYLNGVVHHVDPPDRPALLDRLRRLLAPGGALAIFENNSIHPGTRWVMRRIPFDRGAKPMTAGSLRRQLRRAGFADIVATRYCFFFPRFLSGLDRLERTLSPLPLGTQYLVLARRQRSG